MRTKLMEERVNSIVSDAVEIEREFVCDALPCALVWMTRELMSQYIEFVVDRLLRALGYGKVYGVANPFDWMELILLQGKTNFFEKRVGDYQKASIGWESVMKMGQDTRELFFYETFLYYNPLLLITMMVWLWGVNLWVFSRTGVDYAAIFYLGPDHHSHKEIWKVLQFLSYLPSLSNDFLKNLRVSQCARWMTTITLTSMTVYLYLHVLGCFSTSAEEVVAATESAPAPVSEAPVEGTSKEVVVEEAEKKDEETEKKPEEPKVEEEEDKTETPVVVEEAKTEEKDEVTETLAVVEEEEKAKAEEVVAAGEVAAEKTDE
ncbi:unnamed protein product [Brassica napus]|uniref:(rape) hypothetical protein n=1 Tax=Brassica napus TaxID=3708 RepID=A0A816XUV5_BRANA|nr:unnamed protein product [Brassica napus]